MKKILLIGTGSTIASDITPEGLSPELDSKRLLDHIPNIKNIYKIDCVQRYNPDSTNIKPYHRLDIAEVIEKRYESYDGFIISHGTDTTAYTCG